MKIELEGYNPYVVALIGSSFLDFMFEKMHISQQKNVLFAKRTNRKLGLVLTVMLSSIKSSNQFGYKKTKFQE